MKPIKLRAQYKDDLIYFDLDSFQGVDDFIKIYAKTRNGDVYDPTHYAQSMVGWHDIGIETIEQFIGITDKDETEIYEGDIVRSVDNKLWRVIAVPGCFVIQSLDKGKRENFIAQENKFTVVGNIHEDPSLLTNKKGVNDGSNE